MLVEKKQLKALAKVFGHEYQPWGHFVSHHGVKIYASDVWNKNLLSDITEEIRDKVVAGDCTKEQLEAATMFCFSTKDVGQYKDLIHNLEHAPWLAPEEMYTAWQIGGFQEDVQFPDRDYRCCFKVKESGGEYEVTNVELKELDS